MLWAIATLLLASVPLASGQGTVTVNNAPPTISASSIYDGTHTTNVTNTMIDPAVNGIGEEYQVTVTIGDNNTLYDIKNVTVYVYDDNHVTGHPFVNGTYSKVGSYGFAWVNASGVPSWRELTALGWSGTLSQLESAKSSSPDLSQSSGNWVFEFRMNEVSRRTVNENGWKVQIYVYDGSDAKAADNTLHFGINWYHKDAIFTAVTWRDATLGVANQSADELYTYSITSNAPFKIQIRSLSAALTGTHGQTPFDIGNVTINNDGDMGQCKIAHLSTYWQDFDSNDLGYAKTNDSHWYITIPSVLRDDTYTFNFESTVVMVDP